MKRLETEIEAAVRRFLALIAPNYDIVEAIVFGSYARGEQTPDSDVDVAVLLRGEPPQSFHQTLRVMSDAAYDVMMETESSVCISPYPVWMVEWEHPESYSNPDLLQKIREEGIRL